MRMIRLPSTSGSGTAPQVQAADAAGFAPARAFKPDRGRESESPAHDLAPRRRHATFNVTSQVAVLMLAAILIIL
jgi:hypothetical protein